VGEKQGHKSSDWYTHESTCGIHHMGACEKHATLKKLNSLADSQNLSQLANKIYDVQIWMALLAACRLWVVITLTTSHTQGENLLHAYEGKSNRRLHDCTFSINMEREKQEFAMSKVMK